MDWLNERYPNAMKLDDYGMHGRDFPPEVVEYVHAHWIRTGDVYSRPVNEIRKEVQITNLKILTPEQAEEIRKDPTVIQANAVMDARNQEALAVMKEKGPDKAAEFMMQSAGGDYARMRSMYG